MPLQLKGETYTLRVYEEREWEEAKISARTQGPATNNEQKQCADNEHL